MATPTQIHFVVNRESVGTLLDRIAQAMKATGFFWMQRRTLLHGQPPQVQTVTLETLPALLVTHVEIGCLADRGGILEPLGYRMLSPELAQALLLSPVLDQLDPAPDQGSLTAASDCRTRAEQVPDFLETLRLFAGARPATAAEWVERIERAGHPMAFVSKRGPLSARSKATRLGRFFVSMLSRPLEVGSERYELRRHFPQGVEGKPVYEFILWEASHAPI